MREPKIVVWDIETTPILAYSWDLYPEKISHDSIVQDWSIICGCWKIVGKDKVHSVAVKEVGNDLEVVMTLRSVLVDADILVHHNGNRFDLKKFNARLIYHGLEPLPKIPTVDTLVEVKKVAAFSSNRLDYLSKFLIGKGKIHVEYSLWLDVMRGSKKAVKTMVAYNKVDVLRDEELYLKLRPYMKNHPHIGVMQDKDRCSCNKCGSTKMKKNGIRVTASGIKKQEMQCQGCGSYSSFAITAVQGKKVQRGK